ncbi:immunoglobulin-like domain-containing protein [Hwangdonia seohaensis]|uniref:Immunoglobulin-like domain-containing protein n=1 Tax=Hwangdonia seohaensis TaxID=1240727 RepID=A0ABW3R9C7_9FLAO
MKKLLLSLLILFNVTFAFSQSNDVQKAEKYLSTKGELTFTFKVNSQKEIDNYSKDFSIVNYDSKTKTVKAWANKNQFRAFQAKHIPFQVPESENEMDADLIYDSKSKNSKGSLSAKGLANTLSFPVANYPTYAQYAQQMQDFENDYPTLVDKFSIGTTTQGDKELLFVKISDNVGTDEQEPKLLFTSSMHGDEIAGYPMMLSLIDYILTVYSNPGHADHARVKNLVENTEIWINPNANPDGTYHNSPSNTSVANARRGNANNVDLNRNYPDNVQGAHTDGNAYQTETLAFMALADANHFVISANFHGGTELVNYPFDNAYVSQYTHPDGNWFEFTGVEYAMHAQNDSDALGDTTYMTADDDSNVYPSPGVTHGAEWYRVYGGRQDFMNFYHQCREITVELSDTKILPESQLVNYWLYNRDALLDYLTQGTYGFRGTVKDANTNNPIDATVTIVGHDAYGSHTVTDISHGDYYRPIKAGTYDILFEAPCYQPVTLTGQTISDYQTLALADVLLTPIGAVAPTGLSASNLGATTASLSWDATSGATYDLRYREDGNSTWTDVNGLSSASTNLTGLTALTQYEAQVRSNCNGGSSSAYSASINFTTTNVQLNYCNSASTNVNDEYIGRVQLNTIDNSSGAQFYTDFTSVSTTLTKDTQFTITVTPTWTGTTYNEGYSVWIDYNIDGDFDDAGEQVWTNARTKTTPVSGNFTIPSTAVEGSTRMRVSMKYNAVPTSCETFQYGEVEDYTVVIQGLVDTTAPVITLNGAATINLNVGDVYTEQGATANDNKDGDISASIVVGGDVVDTNTAGTYVVTYNVSDAAGNAATQVTRTVNVIPDTTAPVITLNGASTINLNVGDVYNEQGATAIDNKDGDITAGIVVAGDVVDTNTAGTYVVTYNVSDAAGNTATQVTRTVNVIPDTTAPVITLNGASTIDLNVGDTYTEQGATASDNKDGDITASIVVAGDVVDTNTAGTYVVTYNVSDAAGNAATQVTRTVNVIPDTTAPVITLNGASTINLNVGDVYTEQGATANDNKDGDISASIVVGGDVVDTNTAGTYVVTYNVNDAAGNAATQITRTVNVIPDTTAPVITLNGASTINLNVGDVYTEQGATANDNKDGDITASIVVAGDVVDTNTAGTYVVTYNVSDAAGNAATQVTRTVNVIPDTTAPVITLNGASTINLNVGDVYTEQGATAIDNKDGDITAGIVVAGDVVDTNTAGTYVVTYNVSDAAGNAATQVTRTVNVIPDTTAPVITLNGAATINLNVGDVYTEQGATANDNKDGDITASIVVAGDVVDTNTAGTYVVTYNVSDAAGNAATQVTRTINVAEVPNGCTGGISSFPYTEGFENTLGAWTQSTSDDINWTVDANGTPSNNTGPASAVQGSYYVFVEASSPNYPSKRAILNSPCFDLSGLTEATFSFKYHMYGSSDMGTIDLEVSTDEGSTWTSIWSQTGNKGNSWQTANVDVSAYTGGGIQLRFNRFVGGTWQADIAIDDVSMVEGGIVVSACSGGITSFPYTEGFENTLGAWTQSTSDDINWTVDANGTPSGSTGPASAVQGSYYIFVEASGNGTGYPNKQAIINSPCYDLSGQSSATFSFSYHMYGASDMGTIALEASNDNGLSWTSIWNQSGNKGNSWQTANVDLAAYVGNSVQLRFNRVTGSTWQADIALDNINLTASSALAKNNLNDKLLDVNTNTLNTFKLFPNPVKGDVLNIKLSKGTNLSYKIINMLGQVVNTGKTTKEVKVNNLEAGVYYIEVNDGNTTMTKKFIKRK